MVKFLKNSTSFFLNWIRKTIFHVFIIMILIAINLMTLVRADFNEYAFGMLSSMVPSHWLNNSMNNKLIEQKKLLSSHKSKITGQSKELAAQKARFSAQSKELTAQKAKFSAQGKELTAQKAKLSVQSKELSSQKKVIDGTKKKLISTQLDLDNQKTKINHLKVKTDTVSRRILKRTVANVSANVAAIPAESIPVVGIAVIVATTTLDIVAACKDMKDLNELRKSFSLTTEVDEERVCGMKL